MYAQWPHGDRFKHQSLFRLLSMPAAFTWAKKGIRGKHISGKQMHNPADQQTPMFAHWYRFRIYEFICSKYVVQQQSHCPKSTYTGRTNYQHIAHVQLMFRPLFERRVVSGFMRSKTTCARMLVDGGVALALRVSCVCIHWDLCLTCWWIYGNADDASCA